MKRWGLTGFAGALLAASMVTRGVAAEPPLSPQEAAQVVAVSDLSVHDGKVFGTLQNKTGRVVRDVRLLIRHAWVWKNERHPGSDNPGRADYFIVHTPIPAGESVPFAHTPTPPLPQRSDGHFNTSVEVVGFEEAGS